MSLTRPSLLCDLKGVNIAMVVSMLSTLLLHLFQESNFTDNRVINNVNYLTVLHILLHTNSSLVEYIDYSYKEGIEFS